MCLVVIKPTWISLLPPITINSENHSPSKAVRGTNGPLLFNSRFHSLWLRLRRGLAAVTGVEVFLGGHNPKVPQLQLILLQLRSALQLLLLVMLLLLLLQLAFDHLVKGWRFLPPAERVGHLEGIANDVVEFFSLRKRGKRGGWCNICFDFQAIVVAFALAHG